MRVLILLSVIGLSLGSSSVVSDKKVGDYVYAEPDGKPVVGTLNSDVAKVYQGKLYLSCTINGTDLLKLAKEEHSEANQKKSEAEDGRKQPLPGLTWWNVTSGNKVEIVMAEYVQEEEVEEGSVEEEEKSGVDLSSFLGDDDEDKKDKKLEAVRMDKNKLMLYSQHEYDLIGNFECEYQGKSQQFRSIRPLIVAKFKPSYTVTEGDDQKIHCQVKDPKPDSFTIKWYIRNMDGTLSAINNSLVEAGVEPHIKTYTKNDVENAELKIEDVMMSDRSIYVCEVISDEENVTLETLLRVKDKYAALWPFIGIVIEVVLLCAVILLCEKRKEGDDMEDDITLAGGANDAAENSNLRHRK